MFKTAIWRRCAACIAALIFISSAAAQQRFDHEDVIEKRLPARPGETLMLKSDLGSVQIEGDADAREVVVTVIKGVNGRSESEAADLFDRFEVSFDETSRGIEIRGDYERFSWGFRGNRLHVRYEISVPLRYNVEVVTAGGSIDIRDLEGNALAKTSGGSIALSEIEGPVTANTSGGSIRAAGIGASARLNTSGGSISVENIDGDLDANTSGGSITAESVLGELVAHTSGGSIRLIDVGEAIDASTSGGSIIAEITGQPHGPVSLKTSGGSVRVALSPDVRAVIDAHTTGGRIHSDIPVSGDIGRGRIRAELNGGGPLLTLRTTGGGIAIQSR